MTNLLAVFAGKGDHPYLGAFIMILIGAFVFYAAFKQYRQYRILADAPKARVRSMPMGLVHLHGKATGEPLTSPLTGTRCFTYVADIQEWVRTRTKNGWKWSWRTTAGDDDFKQFYLDDGTGRVLVNPGGAEESIDMQPMFYCEIDKEGHFKSSKPANGVSAPSEQAVWSWIHGAHHRKLAEKHFELEAGSVAGGDPEKAKKVMLGVFNAMQQVSSLGTAPRVESLGAAFQAISDAGLRGGPYRVTEKCFLAESDCVIVGTCAENPKPTNGEDRNLIRKGENEKTFLISTQGEGKIGRNLRLQALALFVLGIALIAGGFALAMHSAGML